MAENNSNENKETEVSNENKDTKTNKFSFSIKKERIWQFTTLGLAVLLIIVSMTGGVNITGLAASADEGKAAELGNADEVGADFIDYLNNNVLQGAEAQLQSIEEEDGKYHLIFSINDRPYEVYSEDGRRWMQEAVDLDEEPRAPAAQQQAPETEKTPIFTEEQNALIQEFSSCLYEKGIRVYYAGWCGYCHSLIETFGGLENAGEIMIECQTADRQTGEGAGLCEEEGIRGFPTIKINGEPYSNARTFEAFAEATGCPAPELS